MTTKTDWLKATRTVGGIELGPLSLRNGRLEGEYGCNWDTTTGKHNGCVKACSSDLDPRSIPAPPETPRVEVGLDARIDSKIERTETCWNWRGSLTHLGYGQVASILLSKLRQLTEGNKPD